MTERKGHVTRDTSWSTKRFFVGLLLGVTISVVMALLARWGRLDQGGDRTLVFLMRAGGDFVAKAFLAGTVIVNMGLIDFSIGVMLTTLLGCVLTFVV
jgi:hypothetical protein